MQRRANFRAKTSFQDLKKRLCPLISVDNLENLCQYSFNYLINVMELKNNKSSVHISGTVEPRYNEVGYNKILL